MATKTTKEKAAPKIKAVEKEVTKTNGKFAVNRNGLPALEVSSFSKRYKKKAPYAVSDVSFKVFPGEFHGFIGANGAGKTTTIKSLIGAYARYEGEVKIFGLKSNTAEAKSLIGYIPESANFPKNINALEYITYMSYLSGLTKKDAKALAIKNLKDIGMLPLAKRKPSTFSSGQKKKILLAQALAHDPKMLIMDEPAANLDPKARFEFFDNLKFLQKQGKAIFISSHILTELDKFVDSVTILDGGKVVYTGTVAELTKNEEMIYRIHTDNDVSVKKFLKSKKISFKISDDKDAVILAKMLNRKNIMDFLTFTNKSKILISEFKNNVISLDEVYNHFVKLGSVETKGQHSKDGRKKAVKNA